MKTSKKGLAFTLATATAVGGVAACGEGTNEADTTTTTTEEPTTSTVDTTIVSTTTEAPPTTVRVRPKSTTTIETTTTTFAGHDCRDFVPPTTQNRGDPMVVCGRPYRRRRGLMLPNVFASGDAPDEIPQDIVALSSSARVAAGERWLADAQSELASVPAFSELSLHLSAVGAPLELVTQAHRAALDEVRHANECLRLASLFLGRRFELGALPQIAGRRVAGRRWWSRRRHLAHLAVQSLIDGCVSEGNSADDLRARAKADVASAATVARRLATDEDRHTELAWQIVEWCKAEGGAHVERALRRAMARLSGNDLGVAAARLVNPRRSVPTLVPSAAIARAT